MEPVIKIVELSPSEWKRYKDIRLEAFSESPQAFLISFNEAENEPDEKWKAALEDAEKGNRWLIFAEKEGEIIGMTGAFISEEYKGKNTAKIIEVFVSSRARGLHVGRMLLEAMIEKLRKLGMERVILVVNKEQIPAYSLYKSLGFKGIEDMNIMLGDGKSHEELVMELNLLN